MFLYLCPSTEPFSFVYDDIFGAEEREDRGKERKKKNSQCRTRYANEISADVGAMCHVQYVAC